MTLQEELNNFIFLRGFDLPVVKCHYLRSPSLLLLSRLGWCGATAEPEFVLTVRRTRAAYRRQVEGKQAVTGCVWGISQRHPAGSLHSCHIAIIPFVQTCILPLVPAAPQTTALSLQTASHAAGSPSRDAPAAAFTTKNDKSTVNFLLPNRDTSCVFFFLKKNLIWCGSGRRFLFQAKRGCF